MAYVMNEVGEDQTMAANQWRLRTLVLAVAIFGLIFGAEVFVSRRSPEELNFNVFVLGIAGVFVGLRAMFWFLRTATPIRTRRFRRNGIDEEP
jgi:hypothetical protein